MATLFKKKPANPGAALTLRNADGAPLYTFPSAVITSMRHMETTLLYKNALPARIAIASALRGEGVTYTTLALATTLAYDLVEARICVVELNWWSPSIKIVPDPEEPPRRWWQRAKRKRKMDTSVTASESTALVTTVPTGLAAVLMDASTLDEALVPTALPNLSLLPAGNLTSAQRPALARSDALKDCIDLLGERFDHILLDIPAILTTSDSIALASLGGACCIVIRQGVTPVSNVRRALDDVKHLPMLGVMLNQDRLALPRWVRGLVPQE